MLYLNFHLITDKYRCFQLITDNKIPVKYHAYNGCNGSVGFPSHAADVSSTPTTPMDQHFVFHASSTGPIQTRFQMTPHPIPF
jgi:hypothetical protein